MLMSEAKASHVLTEEELSCLRGCEKYPQYYNMRKGFEAGTCPFCTIDPKVNKVLLQSRTGRWKFWKNPFKLKDGMVTHALLVSQEHVRHIWKLEPPDFEELGEICKMIGEKYGVELDNSSVLMRQGDMRLNAGTVPHLHLNFYVPNGIDELRLPLFKKEADIEENMKRMRNHAIRYETGEVP
jgi:diadenosine tetraphosphate (Ap4A) HIT family hydrolase